MRMYECVKSTAEYCNNCRVFFHTFIYHTQHESKLICHGDRKKLEKKTLAEILNYRSHTNKMDNWEEYFLKPTQHFQSHWHQPFLIILFTWEAGVGWGEGGIPVVSYFIFCYIYMLCPWSWTLGYISVSIYTQMSKDTTYTHKMLQSVENSF